MSENLIDCKKIVYECIDLILDNSKFDKHIRDQGQWLCYLVYGENWMNESAFKEDNKTFPNFSEETYNKLKEIHEELKKEEK